MIAASMTHFSSLLSESLLRAQPHACDPLLGAPSPMPILAAGNASRAAADAAVGETSLSHTLVLLLASNQIFLGGLLLGVVGVVLAYLRFAVHYVRQWLVGLFMVRLEVRKGDEAFTWILSLLAAENERRNRSPSALEVSSFRHRPRYMQRLQAKPTLVFSMANGSIDVLSFTHLGKTHRIWLSREERSGGSGQARGGMSAYMGADGVLQPQQVLTLSMIHYDTSVLRALAKSAMEMALEPHRGLVTIFTSQFGNNWCLSEPKLPRPFASVVLPNGLASSLVNDAKQFFQARDWYADHGLNWSRGWLLYGEPGCGKSSTIFALASRLSLSICILSLNSRSMDDNNLQQLLSSVPANSIVLVEDVDAVFKHRGEGKDEKSSSNVTFSGLLNAIDGVASSEGRLLILTTNHVERLDPALVRPGRIDRRFEFKHATTEQFRRLFAKFFFHKSDKTVAAEAEQQAVAHKSDDELLSLYGVVERETAPVEDLDVDKHEPAKSVCDELMARIGKPIEELHVSMSLLQGFLLRHRTSPETVIEHVDDLLEEIDLVHEQEAKQRAELELEKAKAKKAKAKEDAAEDDSGEDVKEDDSGEDAKDDDAAEDADGDDKKVDDGAKKAKSKTGADSSKDKKMKKKQESA